MRDRGPLHDRTTDHPFNDISTISSGDELLGLLRRLSDPVTAPGSKETSKNGVPSFSELLETLAGKRHIE